jgi:1,4-alpha-glucan branching enzyme
MQRLIRDLNHLYRDTPSLHVNDTRPSGFAWLEGADMENSVFAYVRRGGPDDPEVVVVLNMTPVERSGYRLGLPVGGDWSEVMNTDATAYGGGGRGNLGGIHAESKPWMGQDYSAEITVPPLSAVIFKRGRAATKREDT